MSNYNQTLQTNNSSLEEILNKINELPTIEASGYIKYNNERVTNIPDYAFYNCAFLNEVDCPNVTNIGASAFEGCSGLRTVTVYGDAIAMGENAFKSCPADLILTCFFDQKPSGWHNNWNPDNIPVIWKPVIEAWDIGGPTAMLCTNNGTQELFVYGNGQPYSYSGEPVPWFLYYNSIKTLTIKKGITVITDYLFSSLSQISNIFIPDSVRSIWECAFQNCTSLGEINISSGLLSIASGAFSGCTSLTNIIYNGTMEEWGSIIKSPGWNQDVPATYVQCSDGQVTL